MTVFPWEFVTVGNFDCLDLFFFLELDIRLGSSHTATYCKNPEKLLVSSS